MSAGVVLVTGGSRGIGRALVRALVAEGRRVAFTYCTGEAAAFGLESECGGLAKAWRFDLADRRRPGTLVPHRRFDARLRYRELPRRMPGKGGAAARASCKPPG